MYSVQWPLEGGKGGNWGSLSFRAIAPYADWGELSNNFEFQLGLAIATFFVVDATNIGFENLPKQTFCQFLVGGPDSSFDLFCLSVNLFVT